MQSSIRVQKVALSLAASAEGRSIAEIMQEFGLGKRTAQRTIAALTELFPVDQIHEGKHRRYRISAGVSAFHLTPSAQELADLELAAQMFHERGDDTRAASLRDLSRRNLAALRESQRHRLAPDVEILTLTQLPVATPGPQVPVSAEIVSTCQTALLAQKLLGFSYVSTSGKSSNRMVAVRGLLIGPRSYLVAAASESEDPVLFRLDRMNDVKITNALAWLDPEFDLDSFRARSFGIYQEAPSKIHLIFDAEVADEARAFRFHPRQTLRSLPGGRLSVKFTAGGLQELALHLVQWGPRVTIVSPAELKAELITLLRNLLARHESEGDLTAYLEDED